MTNTEVKHNLVNVLQKLQRRYDFQELNKIKPIVPGMSGGGMRAMLEFLSEEDSPVLNMDIAEEFDIRPSSATQQVTKAEKLGYVKRVDDPNDGRKKLIEITNKGLNFIGGSRQRQETLVDTFFGVLNEDEQETLLSLLIKLDNAPDSERVATAKFKRENPSYKERNEHRLKGLRSVSSDPVVVHERVMQERREFQSKLDKDLASVLEEHGIAELATPKTKIREERPVRAMAKKRITSKAPSEPSEEAMIMEVGDIAPRMKRAAKKRKSNTADMVSEEPYATYNVVKNYEVAEAIVRLSSNREGYVVLDSLRYRFRLKQDEFLDVINDLIKRGYLEENPRRPRRYSATKAGRDAFHIE
ncbi:MAG: MarR family winged helix-turn-helix transcriptional regulator [Lactobacillaceae bacterium]|nr:MarR family winged helix-turn-helix transcriptional regulator [Lactobacillaceae bacterium]